MLCVFQGHQEDQGTQGQLDPLEQEVTVDLQALQALWDLQDHLDLQEEEVLLATEDQGDLMDLMDQLDQEEIEDHQDQRDLQGHQDPQVPGEMLDQVGHQVPLVELDPQDRGDLLDQQVTVDHLEKGETGVHLVTQVKVALQDHQDLMGHQAKEEIEAPLDQLDPQGQEATEDLLDLVGHQDLRGLLEALDQQDHLDQLDHQDPQDPQDQEVGNKYWFYSLQY